MGLLDFVKGRGNDRNESPGWQPVAVYLYRADGRYPPARWAQTPEQFAEIAPRISEHMSKRLEVRVTNTQDQMLFHATEKGVEWDGIGLGLYLEEERARNSPGDARDMQEGHNLSENSDRPKTIKRPTPSWER